MRNSLAVGGCTLRHRRHGGGCASRTVPANHRWAGPRRRSGGRMSSRPKARQGLADSPAREKPGPRLRDRLHRGTRADRPRHLGLDRAHGPSTRRPDHEQSTGYPPPSSRIRPARRHARRRNALHGRGVARREESQPHLICAIKPEVWIAARRTQQAAARAIGRRARRAAVDYIFRGGLHGVARSRVPWPMRLSPRHDARRAVQSRSGEGSLRLAGLPDSGKEHEPGGLDEIRDSVLAEPPSSGAKASGSMPTISKSSSGKHPHVSRPRWAALRRAAPAGASADSGGPGSAAAHAGRPARANALSRHSSTPPPPPVQRLPAPPAQPPLLRA